MRLTGWTTCVSQLGTTWNGCRASGLVNTASASMINGINGRFAFFGAQATRRSRNRRLPSNETDITTQHLAPVHPGEILAADFLKPMGISQYRLAMDISVPPRRINEIVHGKRGITADTALRLARYFRTSERFWLNLQMQYDLDVQRDHLGDRLAREVTPRAG